MLSCLSLSTSTAHAARGEAIVSGEAGVLTTWAAEGEPGLGALVGAHLWVGLDDFAWLGLSVSSGPVFDGGGASAFTEAMAGAALTFDVFRWVPWAELAVGASGPSDALRATGRLSVGVDYFLTPAWSLGPSVRIRPLPGDDGVGGAFGAGLRISRRFEP